MRWASPPSSRAPALPEPLPITFVGESLENAAELVTRVVGECRDAGVALSRVELDPALWGYLRASGHVVHVLLVSCADLSGQARFYRR